MPDTFFYDLNSAFTLIADLILSRYKLSKSPFSIIITMKILYSSLLTDYGLILYLAKYAIFLTIKFPMPINGNTLPIASTQKKHGHKVTMFSFYSYSDVYTKSYLLKNSLLIFSASAMYSVLIPLLTPQQ